MDKHQQVLLNRFLTTPDIPNWVQDHIDDQVEVHRQQFQGVEMMLEQELKDARDELDELHDDNWSLRDKVKELEHQIEALEALCKTS